VVLLLLWCRRRRNKASSSGKLALQVMRETVNVLECMLQCECVCTSSPHARRRTAHTHAYMHSNYTGQVEHPTFPELTPGGSTPCFHGIRVRSLFSLLSSLSSLIFRLESLVSRLFPLLSQTVPIHILYLKALIQSSA